METTDYVGYELAVKLKACGFDEPCNFYYTKEDAPDGAVWFTGDPRDPQDYNHLQDDCPFAKPICSAPHIYHAQKWLRKVKHISVRVSYIHYHKVWFADWLNLDSGEFDDTDATFATYEEALADGISVALELIEQEKE